MQWYEYLAIVVTIVFIFANIASFLYGIKRYNLQVNQKFSFKKNFVFETHDLPYSSEILLYRGMIIFSMLVPFAIVPTLFQKDIFSLSSGIYLLLSYSTYLLYLICFGFSFFVKPTNIKLFTGLIAAKFLLLLISFIMLFFSNLYMINRLNGVEALGKIIPFYVLMVISGIIVLLNILSFFNSKLYTWFIDAKSQENKTNFLSLYEWINAILSYVLIILFVITYLLY